jgi:putative SOS response-associated peptidase YedK
VNRTPISQPATGRRRPVSTAVNNVRNDGPELIEPADTSQ